MPDMDRMVVKEAEIHRYYIVRVCVNVGLCLCINVKYKVGPLYRPKYCSNKS